MLLTGFRCITLLHNCIISEKHYMALLCRVVAAPSSSCVAAARWFLGIEEPLNETETGRKLQTEKRREHLHSWAGLPQLGGEDNEQGWNRKGGMCVVYTCWITGKPTFACVACH